jgi:hypothetical protein
MPRKASDQKQKPKTTTSGIVSFSVSSSYWSDGKTTIEKQIQIMNKDGKVTGKYHEKKNGKIVNEKTIKPKTSIKK